MLLTLLSLQEKSVLPSRYDHGLRGKNVYSPPNMKKSFADVS